MQLIDPTATDPSQQYLRAPAFSGLDGKVIGLLSNSKLNADLLLQETAAIFQTEHQCEVREIKFKRNASAPAPSETIDQLISECDFLITAAGD